MIELRYDSFDSPVGTIVLVMDGDHLCSLDFADYELRMMSLLKKRYGPVHLTRMADPFGYSSRVQDYLAGDFGCLDDIPVKTGGTPFQQRVWSALREIPVGTTTTYGELARKLGKPTAYRAVGAANGLNPVGIVIPCHRVIGADATLTGYAGGLQRKRWLLQHEGFTFPLGKN